MSRLIAILLVFTLTGPSAVALLCEWSCASAHRVSDPAATGACHNHGSAESVATMGPGHRCHEPSGQIAAAVAPGSHAELRVLLPAVVLPVPQVPRHRHTVVPPRGLSHVPLPLVASLRI